MSKRMTVWDEELGSYLYADSQVSDLLDHRDLMNYIGFLEDLILTEDDGFAAKIDAYRRELHGTCGVN